MKEKGVGEGERSGRTMGFFFFNFSLFNSKILTNLLKMKKEVQLGSFTFSL